MFGIPLGIYLAFKWHLGLHGLWIGLTFSLIYSSILSSWVCFRTDWNKEVVKVIERLKEGRPNEEGSARKGEATAINEQ